MLGHIALSNPGIVEGSGRDLAGAEGTDIRRGNRTALPHALRDRTDTCYAGVRT